MNKIIQFIRVRPPSALGYFDPVAIIGIDDQVIDNFAGRTTPNPIHPKTGQPWDLSYGCIANGWHSGHWGNDSRGRYCIIINGGREVPAILPNKNHGWKMIVTGAQIHSGFRADDPKTAPDESWSGSAGCLTIDPTQWARFCGHFVIGEEVKIFIRGI